MVNKNLHVYDTIRPASPDDYPEISAWLRARKLSGLDVGFVPPQGFIAPGVACGFMITTNTGVYILEHFASNPEAPRESRRLALERIADLLIAAGQSSGAKMFIALTKQERVKRLCTMNGFSRLPEMEVWVRGSE